MTDRITDPGMFVPAVRAGDLGRLPKEPEVITLRQLYVEAAGLLSEDGENPEYDRAIVELVTRLTPGLNHDHHDTVLTVIKERAR